MRHAVKEYGFTLATFADLAAARPDSRGSVDTELDTAVDAGADAGADPEVDPDRQDRPDASST